MKWSIGIGVVVVFVGLLIFPSVSSFAEEPKPSKCDSIKDNDQRNLCLAKSIDKKKEFGYKNKDHSSYYCSIIRSRDLQNYCYAVVRSDKGMCDLIGNKDIEKDCKANF